MNGFYDLFNPNMGTKMCPMMKSMCMCPMMNMQQISMNYLTSNPTVHMKLVNIKELLE